MSVAKNNYKNYRLFRKQRPYRFLPGIESLLNPVFIECFERYIVHGNSRTTLNNCGFDQNQVSGY
jgi:hypothetical protein